MKKRLKDKLRRKKQLNQQTEPDKPTTDSLSESEFARVLRKGFNDSIKDSLVAIDDFDDEELLRLGKEAFPYKMIEKIIEVRDLYFSRMHNIPPQEKPYALLEDFNQTIEKAWQKLADKWARAEQLFPELAEQFRDDPENIYIEEGKSPYQTEMEKTKQSLDEGMAFRVRAIEKLEANPANEDLRAVLAELDDALEIGKRRLSAATAKTYRQILVDTDVLINEDIENATDEELIKSIYETDAVRHLCQYIEKFGQARQSLSNLLPDDESEKISNLFERTIIENRKKLEAKRNAAQKRNPQIKKEYPMDDNYNKALADLLEAIETRDEMARDLKLILPKDRPEGLRLLQELDKKIEQGEQALAVEYEAFQAEARAMDVLRFEMKLASRQELNGIRQYLKDNPEEMPELQQLLAEEFPE